MYALCALLDESAAATPWGQNWIEHGLLHALRGESGGAEGFFTQLDRISAEPEKNADLLEFFYICLALGFEGRYGGTEGDRQALQQVKDRLYELIARRRPRPDALSEHWRTPAAQAAADAALKTAERANAARAAAAAAAAMPAPQRADVPGRYALSRWPRRAIWSAVAGIVGASLVLYMLGTRLQEEEARDAMAPAKPAPAEGRAGAGHRRRSQRRRARCRGHRGGLERRRWAGCPWRSARTPERSRSRCATTGSSHRAATLPSAEVRALAAEDRRRARPAAGRDRRHRPCRRHARPR